MDYKQFLYYLCKWSTTGLNGDDFNAWHKLINKLDKECKDCEEGYICESCKNTGLNLNITEKMIVRGIEMSLDANKTNATH